jgi:hypothetical protein
MIAYVVTSGRYSDYGIDGIFSTEEKAQEFMDSGEVDTWRWEGPRIEEWTVDEWQPREHYWFVLFDQEGTVLSAREVAVNDDDYFLDGEFSYGVAWQKNSTTKQWSASVRLSNRRADKQHAIKAAYEQMMMNKQLVLMREPTLFTDEVEFPLGEESCVT